MYIEGKRGIRKIEKEVSWYKGRECENELSAGLGWSNLNSWERNQKRKR